MYEMHAMPELIKASLEDRAREAQRERLVREALRTRDEGVGRDRQPMRSRGSLPFGLTAVGRGARALARVSGVRSKRAASRAVGSGDAPGQERQGPARAKPADAY